MGFWEVFSKEMVNSGGGAGIGQGSGPRLGESLWP